MNPRPNSGQGLTASPVLVGAVTLLVAVVAVFLSYNANSGLPFVPTYELTAEVPNAANLVKGNDVRIGGSRVGSVAAIEGVPGRGGRPAYARLKLKLDRAIDPLPVDTAIQVRPRSALGLKYVQLTPGSARMGYEQGDTIPVRRAVRPVEIDEVFNMYTAKARIGSQRSLNGFGTALAGRGGDINTAIAAFRPLVTNLQPVANNLADPRTRLDRLFPALEAAAREVAPVADTQAALFGNLDTTFTSLASVARPFFQEFITESPRTAREAIDRFPTQRAFLRTATGFFDELGPGVRTLPATAPVLADTFETGSRTLARSPRLNRQLSLSFRKLASFAEDPLVRRGIQRSRRFADSLRPTVDFLTPVQTRCNYITLLFRNSASVFSEGDGNGTGQRSQTIAPPIGPNGEGGMASAPARGPSRDNFLHSNPYPNTASPGQPRECEAGNERYQGGRQVIGNVAGNQGTRVDENDTSRDTLGRRR